MKLSKLEKTDFERFIAACLLLRVDVVKIKYTSIERFYGNRLVLITSICEPSLSLLVHFAKG